MSSSRHGSSRPSNSSSRKANSGTHESSVWQNKLEGACREYGMAVPVFHIFSDRRGGRTAWSSRVTVCGQTVSARYWYDGKNLNNAREDAAEVALNCIQASANAAASSSSSSSPTSSRNVW